MKTAISVDDELIREADEAARQMGLSRSRVFALALAEFLQRQRSDQMLLRLNEVYGNEVQSEESRLLKQIKAKVRRTVREPW